MEKYPHFLIIRSHYQAPTALFPGENIPISIAHETEWFPDPSWTLWQTEKYTLFPRWKSSPCFSVSSKSRCLQCIPRLQPVKKGQIPLQYDAYLHIQDCKVWQVGSNVGTFRTNILPPYSAQTLQHSGNILLQKLPLNFTASLPGRYKSLQSLLWEPKISDVQITQRKLKKCPQCTQFLTVFKRLGFLKRFIAQTAYRVCKRINYKIVPVTNLNKYLHYGTSVTE